MKILYPMDWDTLAASPQCVIHEPKRKRRISALLFRVKDQERIPVGEIPVATLVSDSGLLRRYEWSSLPDGQYIARFLERRFDRVIGDIGFFVNAKRRTMSLDDALNTIEACYYALRDTRMIGNGIGKSGTTWLYRLLGSLPGMRCVDMAARGCHGIDYRELSHVAVSEVYHGHLRYGLETVATLDELDYHNVHIYRDLRDIAVSEYFHKFHMESGAHRADLMRADAADLLRFENICKWSSTLYAADDPLSWNRGGHCVMVKYEQLLNEPHSALTRLLTQLGLPVHEALVDYIVYRNDFEVVSGRQRGTADARSPLRNAVAGDWTNYLDTDTAARFYENYRTYFETLGYAP